VVIRRLPEEGSLVRGRSRCEHCGAVLTVRDLAPFASWLATAGRCRHCGARLGWFYPAVELAALALALIALGVDHGAAAWLDFLLGCWLLALGWIDVDHGVLPDSLTLPLIAVGLLVVGTLQPDDVADRVPGAALGYLFLAGVAWAYRRLRGREGLGLGDAKLFAAAGAWVGAFALPSVLLGAAVSALAAAAVMVLCGRSLSRSSALPFGPFLAAATWAVWLYGPIRF
jgi:leader peptidase (prepilin peptidase)/N-methyltransferase